MKKNSRTTALERKMHPQARRMHEQSKEHKEGYRDVKNRIGGYQ